MCGSKANKLSDWKDKRKEGRKKLERREEEGEREREGTKQESGSLWSNYTQHWQMWSILHL